MPSESQAQHAFMAMSRTAKGRAELRRHGRKPAPVAVASDFMKADKGKKVGDLPHHKEKSYG